MNISYMHCEVVLCLIPNLHRGIHKRSTGQNTYLMVKSKSKENSTACESGI